MRNIIYWVHTSVDGYICGPNGEFDWPSMSGELSDYSIAMNESVDTFLYGRKVWEMMSAYWPTADADPATADAHDLAFASLWRATPKIVFSATLDGDLGHNTRVIGRDLAAQVAELKAAPGKDMLLTGGSHLAASLTEHGLIDDYRIVVHPVVLGGGLPLFPTRFDERLNLRLVESRAFDGSAVLLRYQR
ncbi:dihydrofolate reductase family protein [Nonomuraea sp. NPDC059194]|uniref:dihydrofolate reductase family protein n=1 Tax=Nonomuraea sp. NPDC059194 TaxID=3346764 RepID=UPI00369D3710